MFTHAAKFVVRSATTYAILPFVFMCNGHITAAEAPAVASPPPATNPIPTAPASAENLLALLKQQAKSTGLPPNATIEGYGSGSNAPLGSGWPNAIADFIVDRAKDEVAASILLTVQDEISSDRKPYLSLLFPKSAQVIKQLKAANLSLAGLDLVENAFRADVDNLYANLGPWETKILSDNPSASFKDVIKGLEIVGGLGAIYYRVRHNGNILTVFIDVLKDYLVDGPSNPPIKFHLPANAAVATIASIAYVGVFIGNGSPDGKVKPAIDFPNLKQADKEKFLEGFLGLFGGDLSGYPIFKDPGTKNAAIQELAKVWKAMIDWEQFLLDNRVSIAQIAKDPSNPASVALYQRLSDSLSQVISAAIGLAVLFDGPVSGDTASWLTQRDQVRTRWQSVVTQLNLINIDVYSRLYTEAALNAIILLSQVAPSYISPRLSKYVALAGRLASASSSADKYSFIGSLADPTSDFLNKRLGSGVYLNINGYLGATVGLEKLDGQSRADRKSYFGATVPVGLEFGYGFDWDVISAVGVLGSIINVGNLATARIKSNDTGANSVSDTGTSFPKVLAPGGFLVIGLTQKYPISIGFGVEHVHDIRENTAGRPLGGTHYSAFIGIDVPILSLLH